MSHKLESEVLPIPGAAKYFANTDQDRPGKFAVWMVTWGKDMDGNKVKEYYTLSHHNTFAIARKKANQWQMRENISVQKHHPELINEPIITY